MSNFMDDQIKKLASNYFLYFYNLTLKWKTVTEKMEKPLSVLRNQAEQLSHIEHAEIEEFCDFPDLKERLVFKVFIGIDEELHTLRTLHKELSTAVNELKNKLIHFEKSTTNIDWDDQTKICGTALHPSLSDLLQLAYQGWSVYNDLNQNISNTLKCLDIRCEKTLNSFNLSITETDKKKIKINEVVALTQYCYNT